MNFLAHLFLSCDDEALLIGNYMADFIRNKEVALLPEAVQKGVILHRKIDSYTDQHPLVSQGAKRLHEQHHKYAPVMIDIFYDYFLAKNWSTYSAQPLEAFMEQTYITLAKNVYLMPEKLAQRTENMIEHKWLRTYTHLDGMADTFRRVQKRVSKPEYFEGVIDSLVRDEALLNQEFQAFFPDVMQYVKEECSC